MELEAAHRKVYLDDLHNWRGYHFFKNKGGLIKKLLLLCMMFISVDSFAQSHLVLKSGIVLLTDIYGKVHDWNIVKRPSNIVANGGHFIVERNQVTTIAYHAGLQIHKLNVGRITAKGHNYLLSSRGLYTIDKSGYLYQKPQSPNNFRNVIHAGGKFFFVRPDRRKADAVLYTVGVNGDLNWMNFVDLYDGDIVSVGGVFFQSKSDTVYTFDKFGFLKKSTIKFGRIKKAGGNYFVDSTNDLFTVTREGEVTRPELPPKLKVANIWRMGSEYFIDRSGILYVVDEYGDIHEAATNHDLRNVEITPKI